MPLATLNPNKKIFFKFLFFEKVSKNQKIAKKILTTHLFPSNQIFCFPINKFKYNGKISKISLNNLYYKIYKNQILLEYIIIKSKLISGAIHF
jgi:hypothetical protein